MDVKRIWEVLLWLNIYEKYASYLKSNMRNFLERTERYNNNKVSCNNYWIIFLILLSNKLILKGTIVLVYLEEIKLVDIF